MLHKNLSKKFISYSISIFILGACSGGSSRTDKMGVSPSLAKAALDDSKMKLTWLIDGSVNPNTLNTALKDMGWHLITLAVVSDESQITSTKVGGLLAAVYPPQYPNVGQQVVIDDINCNDAVFSKPGDKCSAYFKLDYDTSKPAIDQVPFSIQMAPKNIDSILTFSSGIKPKQTTADYRSIAVIEDKYYAGSSIQKNRGSYRIYSLENGSLSPINISVLQQPANPVFTLIHRSTANFDDFYGDYPECSLNANANLKQVNQLAKLNDSCLLVYNAALSATNAIESGFAKLDSTADYIFPSLANNFTLIASYVNGTPLPEVQITETNGNLHEPMPFKSFALNYNFTPKPIPILEGSKANQLVVPENCNIWQNEPILTNIGGANRITSISAQFKNGQILTSNNIKVTACGGAYASVSDSVVVNGNWTRSGKIQFNFDIDSSGHCGGSAPSHFTLAVPMAGIDTTIYSVDDVGCAGGHWDMGGVVKLSGNCNQSTCFYVMRVLAHHGGLDGECNQTNEGNMNISFARPTNNLLADLSYRTPDPISFAAQGGQTSSGGIGGLNGQIDQAITCSNSGNCLASGIFTNGLSSQDMFYQINLNSGDLLSGGWISFTRSAGYDLDKFTINMGGN